MPNRNLKRNNRTHASPTSRRSQVHNLKYYSLKALNTLKKETIVIRIRNAVDLQNKQGINNELG